jgi:hypothetical protein
MHLSLPEAVSHRKQCRQCGMARAEEPEREEDLSSRQPAPKPPPEAEPVQHGQPHPTVCAFGNRDVIDGATPVALLSGHTPCSMGLGFPVQDTVP